MSIADMTRQIGDAQPDECVILRRVEFRLSDRIHPRSNRVRIGQAARSARRIVGVLEETGIHYDATEEGVFVDGPRGGFAPRKFVVQAPPQIFETYASFIAKSLGQWYDSVNANPPYRTASRNYR